jgi:hypothetical protein
MAKLTKTQTALWDRFVAELKSGTWHDQDRDSIADLATLTLGLVEEKIEIDKSAEENKPRKTTKPPVKLAEGPKVVASTPATEEPVKRLTVGRKYTIRGNEKYDGLIVEFVADSQTDPERKGSVLVLTGNDSYEAGKRLGGIPKRALVGYRTPRKTA